jgi:hypothetical protein
MPLGWKQSNRQNLYKHVYPSNEEILTFGNPVSWQEIMKTSDLETNQELALALKTSIGALRTEYARKDLADKLNSNLKPDLYYPTEDNISVLTFTCVFRALSLRK